LSRDRKGKRVMGKVIYKPKEAIGRMEEVDPKDELFESYVSLGRS